MLGTTALTIIEHLLLSADISHLQCFSLSYVITIDFSNIKLLGCWCAQDSFNITF